MVPVTEPEMLGVVLEAEAHLEKEQEEAAAVEAAEAGKEQERKKNEEEKNLERRKYPVAPDGRFL